MCECTMISLSCGHTPLHWLLGKKGDNPVPVDEHLLARKIHRFAALNEKARQEERRAFLKEHKMLEANIPHYLPNARVKVPGPSDWTPPQPQDFSAGAKALLPLATLFKDPTAGYHVLATILCGLHCTALRKVEEGFHPVLSLPTQSPILCELLQGIVQAVVTKKGWSGHHCRVKRKAVLDYRAKPGELIHHVQDFSKVIVPIKKHPDLITPAPYTDTVAAVIGATSAQLREAAPYMENAGLFLLGCGADEWKPHRLSEASLAQYDPEVAASLELERFRVAALLRAWWGYEEEEAWARAVCAKARASFGKPDSRYVTVVLDPRRLRSAVYHQVILSFFDWLEQLRLLSGEELAPYRAGAKAVFDPAPQPEKVTRHVDDPVVFLEIMRDLAEKHQEKIVAEDCPFRKADKPFGAWRAISGVSHLIMLEKDWQVAYVRACRKAGDLDCAFFQRERWPQELQKILCEADVIKEPSAGFRYRYDLCQAGAKDSTYVIAILRERLETP